MRLIDKYILFSSIFALFTEDIKFNFIIDWKLFYLIIGINILLLLFKKSLFLNKNLFILLGFFFVHGLIFYVLNSNSISSLIAQLIGISLSSIYYYSFIKTYGAKHVFDTYLKMAFILAIIAIPMYILKINVFDYRLNGIMTEPAHYATIMLPAVYVLYKRKKYYKTSIIVLTLILAKSSIGFLGLILMVLIPMFRVKNVLKYFLITLGCLLIGILYVKSNWDNKFNEATNSQVTRRIKQTYESFNAIVDGKFKQNTNLSSYAILSNAFITKQNFINHPLGTGIGSYRSQYEKYYPTMSPPDYLITLKQSKINKEDGNSLFLRLVVDLGIFGFFIVGYFFYRGIKVFKNKDKIIQQGTFFYLILKLIREGHYFPPEFYFFLLIFIKDFDENTTYS